MDIKPSEIDLVEEIGALDGEPVKMIKTIGGYWIAVGKPKSKKRDEALAAGSHPAIVKYNIEKNFPGFQAALAKSEAIGITENVTGYSELLPDSLRDRGYDMYGLEKSEKLSYVLTRNGYEVYKFDAELTQDSLRISENQKSLPNELRPFTKAVSEVAARKAIETGREEVEYAGKKFNANKIVESK